MKTKQFLTFIFALIMIISLVGCGKQSTPDSTDNNDTEQTPTESNSADDALSPEEWTPEKDITIRVPFAAGGSADTFTRIIGQGLQDKYEKTVIINNLTGANGSIAATDLVNQEASASEMMAGGIAMFTLAPLFNPAIEMNLDDFKMVSGIVSEDFILCINPSESGINSWEELEAFGKENRILFGSNTPGGATHMLATALFGDAELEAEAVTSDGSNNDVLALLSGDVTATIAPSSVVEQHIGDESIVPIAVFSDDEYTGFEGYTVPTVKSLGYDIVFRSLNFLMTRSEVEQSDIDAVYNAIQEFFATDKFKDLAEKAKYVPDTSNGEEIKETIEKAAELSKNVYEKYYAQ